MRPTIIVRVLGVALLVQAASGQENQEPPPLVPEGFQLIHGDMLVRQSREKSVFRASQTAFWPGGVVPYVFAANVSAANRTAMLAAMAVWTNVATIRFLPRDSETDFVLIQTNTANNSAVGRQGGQQVINIVSWGSLFIIAHELGHCLGYWHTQSRNDRDTYVQINWSNIQSGQADNFQIETDQRHWGPYDFDSVMHYSQCSFSIDCPPGASCACSNTVMDVRAPNQAWQSLIGQRTHLSYLDGLVMSFLYPQGHWRWLDGDYMDTPQTGAFFTPWRVVGDARSGMPAAGILWITPGTYPVGGSIGIPVTLKAPLGGVRLVN